MNIRFRNNFIIKVVRTTLDENDQLTTTTHHIHVYLGDIHPIDSYEKTPDGKFIFHFPQSSVLHGVAHRIESDYCEIMGEPKSKNVSLSPSTGCGGCKKKENKD